MNTPKRNAAGERGQGERFQVAFIGGRWEELYGRDTRKGYRQRCDMTATVNVHTVRHFSRDRNGKKVETVRQWITGELTAVLAYVNTFPNVPSVRLSSMIDRTGMLVQTQY